MSFYTTPKGYFQVSNFSNKDCDHIGFIDKSGYSFSNGVKTLRRECSKCGSYKIFSTYKK
jgi:hypothetical protein